MPPPIHPDTILDNAETMRRGAISVEASVLTYFGDYFYSLRQGLISAPKKSGHTVPSNTASARNQS
jgi:hypothetical protein